MKKIIEFAVVIVVIGVLSSVGLKYFKKFKNTSKIDTSNAQFTEIINLINSEMFKCSNNNNSDSFVWGGKCKNGITDDTSKNIAIYLVEELEFRNPYDKLNSISNKIESNAYIFFLEENADPINNGNIVIVCNKAKGNCSIKIKPGNKIDTLSAVLTINN